MADKSGKSPLNGRGDGTTLRTQIKEWLIKEFSSYQLEDKLPTNRALAKQLKASLMTVHNAMNELCREGYVTRRQGKGTFLSSRERQVVNEASGNARTKNGKIIIACPNYFSSEYWNRVADAEELAVKNGFDLVEFKMNPDTKYENLMSMAEREENLKAVLIVPVRGSLTRAIFDKLDSLEIPVILLSQCQFISFGKNVVSICGDRFKVGYKQMKHLLDNGHRKIGYISNEPSEKEINLSLNGQKQALLDYGLSTGSLIQTRKTIQPWGNSANFAYELTGEILKKHSVTALIYASSSGALAGLRKLRELKLRVPDDVSIVSTRGNWIIDEYAPPPLTVVGTQHKKEMEAAFELIKGESKLMSKVILFEPELIERESVRRI
ncbi:MAG TPA: hypothetical protein DCZ94_14645 [Lentisphaeria bacterium]|nr:MAG: hypothetical protein A2X48_09930 [Lentisphaerae bacterium GWF2_49_21]HBC88186.1 hypothetical protein [Lentisphaeria bacterium]